MRGRGALGKHGEDDVCQFLIERGHTILDRNWRSGHLEIDIVTLAPDGIHFVEVKSRVAQQVHGLLALGHLQECPPASDSRLP